MSRLIDIIFLNANKLKSEGSTLENWSEPKICEFLNEMIYISSDNVTDHFFQSSKNEYSSFGDFPILAPPFESFFIETRKPIHMNPKSYPEGNDLLQTSRWGILVESVNMEKYRKEKNEEYEKLLNKCPNKEAINNLRSSKWGLSIQLIQQKSKYEISTIDINLGLFLDYTGKVILINYNLSPKYEPIIREARERKIVKGVENFNLNEIREILAKGLIMFHIFPLLLAISFMHCKNVELKKVSPDPKLDKKYMKNHKRKLVEYHVLEIDHMGKTLSVSDNMSLGGIKKAGHICRGHFRDYRETGLFGKLKNIYWFDQHWRGDKNLGIIHKDYKVK